MPVKSSTESESLVMRRCSDERINAPTIQIGDKSATLSVLRTTTESMRPVYAHIKRRPASDSSCRLLSRMALAEFPAVAAVWPLLLPIEWLNPSRRKR